MKMNHQATLRFNPPAYGFPVDAKYKYDYICADCYCTDYASSKRSLIAVIKSDHEDTGVHITDKTIQSNP
jgi:hypothetical protein